MFQYGPLSEIMLRVQHRHADGTWATLEPQPEANDPAQVDPEQEWQRGHIYICRSCQEQVRVAVEEKPSGDA